MNANIDADYDYDTSSEPQRGRTESEEDYVSRLEKHWADLAYQRGQDVEG